MSSALHEEYASIIPVLLSALGHPRPPIRAAVMALFRQFQSFATNSDIDEARMFGAMPHQLNAMQLMQLTKSLVENAVVLLAEKKNLRRCMASMFISREERERVRSRSRCQRRLP